jgi:hypothetical protein
VAEKERELLKRRIAREGWFARSVLEAVGSKRLDINTPIK